MPDYYTGNFYLNQSQMETNAIYIRNYLANRGWTLNAIAGMLGNTQVESSHNPGIWQNLDEGNRNLGFGLVQWTPATKYLDWADANGYVRGSMEGNLQRILWELANGVQYYPTASYPETFREFTQSTKTAYYLGGAFLYNYERPKTPDPVSRGNNATLWYNFLLGTEPPDPPPIDPWPWPPSTEKRGMPPWMYHRGL